MIERSGGGKGWGIDTETGVEVPPDNWQDFAEWLCTDPRDPGTVEEWAAEHGVHRDTPKRWKRDPRFIKLWEAEAQTKNVSVDRVQSVVDALHRSAVTGDVKAASLYLQYIDRFMPKSQIVVKEDRSTKDMSEEELVQAMRAELASL